EGDLPDVASGRGIVEVAVAHVAVVPRGDARLALPHGIESVGYASSRHAGSGIDGDLFSRGDRAGGERHGAVGLQTLGVDAAVETHILPGGAIGELTHFEQGVAGEGNL